MPRHERDSLIDLIYDAALDPALWHDVLRAVGDTVGGSSGWISQLSKADGAGASAKDWVYGIDPDYGQKFAEHYFRLNPFSTTADPAGLMRDWALSISTFESVLPRETLRRMEYGADFLRPLDISSGLMIRLCRLGRLETAVMNINCSYRRDRFDDADLAFVTELHPHLVRAFGLGRRLAAERLTATAESSTAHAVFVLDESGRVQRLNAVAERMVGRPDALRVVGGKLTAVRAEASRNLDGMIRRALTSDPAARSGDTLALATPAGPRPIQVTVAPVSPERAFPHRLGRMALVCASDLNAPSRLSGDRLQALFGLSPAEVRVALALADGESPGAAAERFGVSFQTVRNQLTRIYEKSSTRGQADLVSLIWRVSAGAP
jgi:DNA-binding CsgD family transcriptional regulator/PAS domain-containing protein